MTWAETALRRRRRSDPTPAPTSTLTYRADVWCALDETPDASPAAIARRVGYAYETARSVATDWRLDRSVAA